MIEVHAIQPTDWALYKAMRLRALADSPEAFCSTLAEEALRTDASWQGRLVLAAASGNDFPMFADDAGTAVGMAWVKVDGTTASLYQMWVAPEARGRGAARRIIETGVAWAKSVGASALTLGVTAGDTPAVRLYQRMGFVAVGALEPMRNHPGLQMQNMELGLGSDENT